MTDDILDRLAALEADVSQLKQNSITRQEYWAVDLPSF
jgi:hypothetical protein